MPRLNQRIVNQLTKILAPLMDTPDNRRALLIRSLPREIVLSAPTEGTSPISAVVNIIQFLADYGAFEEDKQALWAVLEVAYDEVGLEKQDLIKSLESIINSSDDRISTDLSRTLTYEEFSLGDVFISYTKADHEYMDKMYKALTHNGIKVWTDKDDLKPGTPDWDADLRRAIRSAKAVILIASPDSRVSDYVRDEIRLAEMYGRPIIPIWSGGTQWMNSIPIGYGGIQYIDGRGKNYSTAMVQLIAQLSSAESLEIAVEQINFTPRNPYKGLNPFSENESNDFFGRDQLIQDLIIKLDEGVRNNERLLAVVGPSGSGKSSVVMAGLLPKLRRGGYDDSESWVYLPRIVPGKRLIENLAIALAHELNFTVDSVEDNLAKSRGLHQLISLMRPQSRVVLFIDQFEELFTQTENEQDRRRYLDLITTAVTESDGALTVVLTLRADFYDRPMHYRDFATLLQNNHEYVLPLSAEELRDVIFKPAAQDDVQLIFDDNLVGDLLYEVKDEVGALPLLQFSLDQLFKNRDEQLITHDAYHTIGGIHGILAQWAQETYDGLASDEDRELAKALLLRLVSTTNQRGAMRRRLFLRELSITDEHLRQRIEVVSSAFINARLLVSSIVMDNDGHELEATIEVTHEALIREWQLLQNWIFEARDDIWLQTKINSDATDWVQRGERADSPRLYRGSQLEEAQEWLSRNFVTDQEHGFIEAGITLEGVLQENQNSDNLIVGIANNIGLRLKGILQKNQSHRVTELPSPTNRAGKNYVFISYSSTDRATFVDRLAKDLKQEGYPMWVDNLGPQYYGITAGKSWKQELADALNQSLLVVFVITPDSLSSEWCYAELKRASEQNIPIIPILARPIKYDEGIMSQIQVGNIPFSEIHYRDFITLGYNKGLEILLSDIEKNLP